MGGRPAGLEGLRAWVDDEDEGLLSYSCKKKFSQRKPVTAKTYDDNPIRTLHYVLQKILTHLAGGTDEVASLLTDPKHGFITSHMFKKNKDEYNKVRENLYPTDGEYPLMRKIGQAFTNSVNDADRRSYLQFVCFRKQHGLKLWRRRLATEFGFRGLGYSLLKSVRKTVAEPGFKHKPLESIQAQRGGAPEVSAEVKAQLEEEWHENSQPAAEIIGEPDTATVDDCPLRFFNAPPYTLAVEIGKKCGCAQNTAIAHCPPHIVKPTKKTDYCRYCAKYRRLLARGKVMVAKLKARYGDGDGHDAKTVKDAPSDHLRKFWHSMSSEFRNRVFSEMDRTQVKEFLNELTELEHHRSVAARQKKAFTKEVNATRTQQKKGCGTCVMVLDFKENIRTGHSPVETDERYYNMSSVTCVGVVVYIGGLQISVDLLSNVMNHTSDVSLLVLEKVVEMLASDNLTSEKFAKISSLSVWSDCGPHFRSSVFIGSTLHKVGKERNLTTTNNYFGEKHGKSVVDSHFQKVSAYLSFYSKTEPILTVEDVQKGLVETQERVNQCRLARNQPSLNAWVEVYTKEDLLSLRPHVVELPMEHITDTYCLQKRPRETFTRNYVFSDYSGHEKYKKITESTRPAGVLRPVKESEDAPEGALGRVAFLKRKRKNIVATLKEAELPHEGIEFAEDLEEDGMSFELLQFLNKYKLAAGNVTQIRSRLNREEQLLTRKVEETGTWAFGRILGEVSNPDLLKAAGAAGRKAIFIEMYYAHATVAEILPQEDMVTSVKEGLCHFVDGLAGVPLEAEGEASVARSLVVPSSALRHSHVTRLKDYWAQCTNVECRKWRIIEFQQYCEARKKMSCRGERQQAAQLLAKAGRSCRLCRKFENEPCKVCPFYAILNIPRFHLLGLLGPPDRRRSCRPRG